MLWVNYFKEITLLWHLNFHSWTCITKGELNLNGWEIYRIWSLYFERKKKKLLKVFENLWNLDWNICRDYETESCCFTWGENTWEFNCVYIPHLIIAIFLTTVTNTTKTLTLRHLSTFPVDRKWLNLVWKHTWVPKLLFFITCEGAQVHFFYFALHGLWASGDKNGHFSLFIDTGVVFCWVCGDPQVLWGLTLQLWSGSKRIVNFLW